MTNQIKYEPPTYPKWKKAHARSERRTPSQYKAKKDTRKSYHWVVLTYLKYDDALIGVEQPTWFRGAGGKPTAFGKILSSWMSYGKICFLIEARNRSSKDTYLVVFAQVGAFITTYSKNRNDIPDKLYPIVRRRALYLLRLSASVSETSRVITDDSILCCISANSPERIEKSFLRYKNLVIPDGIRLGLIAKSGEDYVFMMGHREIENQMAALNPPAFENYAW
ncbi:MAG: hypothetical protein AB7Y74_10685 [Syntrophorhabdus sp.]